MGEMAYTLAFYFSAALTLVAAIGVISSRNLVHSALLLALTFIGVAGLYVLLSADFLSAVQLLVYNGAVAVIIVIGVMLTQAGDMTNSNPSNKLAGGAAVVTGGIMALIVGAIMLTPWKISTVAAPEATAPAIAQILLSDFAIAFEAAAVLLLVAMIGAIILAKGGDQA